MRSSRPAYASLVDVRVLAPVIMAAAGLLAMGEAALVAGNVGTLVAAVVVLGPPTAGTTLAAYGITKRSGALAAGAPFVIAIVEWILGMVFDPAMSSLLVGVSWGITAVLALPMLVLVAIHGGRRPPLDAGDALLGSAGVWLLVLHLVVYALLPRAATIALAGGFGAALLVAVAIARGAQRRAFCIAAARGEVRDHRVRTDVTDAELDPLAPVYGSSSEATAVLERLVPSPGEASGSPYRHHGASVPIGRVAARAG